MLPPAHIAYTWLTLDLLQERLDVVPDADYRLVALAALGPDLLDKPLAYSYFFRRHQSTVLFAHTLLAFLGVFWLGAGRFPRWFAYALAFVGHGVLDRIWYMPRTFFWPLHGWHFHPWEKEGAGQERLWKAYWHAFSERSELWKWEIGGILALICFVWRNQLYRRDKLWQFIITGKLRAR